MDVKLIEQKQLVERWLRGRLPPPEARYFETLMRDSPQLAEELGLPETLRRTMAILDETGTEWRESQPRFWHAPWVPAALGAVSVVLVVALLVMVGGKHDLERRNAKLVEQIALGSLNPPSTSLIVPVALARRDDRPRVYSIGGREHASLTELKVDVSFAHEGLFALLIKREDGTYWGRFDNLVRDSNGELRFTMNSSAFTAGAYALEVNAVNLRGEGGTIGRAELAVTTR